MKQGCSITEAVLLNFKQLFCEIESKKNHQTLLFTNFFANFATNFCSYDIPDNT